MSESEEMYLLTIAQITEGGDVNPVPLTRMAEELSVQPVSVNQMVKKLAEDGMLLYQPYKGVSLLPKGKKIAEHILRRRRIWQVFLVEKLNFTRFDAEALSCKFEHITPREAIEKLYDYLGKPALSPSGLPIQSFEDSPNETRNHLPLSKVKVGEKTYIIAIQADDQSERFLSSQGITKGCEVSVIAQGSDGSMLIRETKSKNKIHLCAEIADQITVIQGRST
ncbi:MAG: metal-dependent transcriptional regulator [Anaerolineales bacterium]|nr:metal-dependent transcriptional regulator [Anaerolineales bacterium]